jgi:hypothetical protein
MGRAAPDLPDPLENAESAPTGGADDLLSQLAGDEIDRLLAEADVEAAPLPEAADAPAAAPAAASDTAEPAPVAADAPVTTGASAPAAAPALESQLDELFNSLNEPPPAAPTEVAAEAVVTPAPVATPAPTATDLDEQLAKLANELLPTPEPVEALTPVDAPAVAEAVPPQDLPQEAPVDDERAALLAEPASDAPPEELYEEAGDEAIPWYLWPLVWLNAPFAALSDGARDRVGKVALATLLFSITVLTFLAVARHHP